MWELVEVVNQVREFRVNGCWDGDFGRLEGEVRATANHPPPELDLKLARPQSFVSKYERGERRIHVVEFLDVARAVGLDAHGVIQELHRATDRSSGL